MKDLDYVNEIIDPWVEKYISHGVKALSPIEKIGVGVWLLEAEVSNGGFDQYYFNTCGVLAVDTVEALKRIGANETAGLLEAANRDIPILPLPENRDERSQILDEVRESSRFGALENEFYSEMEDRISLLAQYLRKNEYGT